ncbi:MAG: hypothetical protein ACOYIK_04670 [Coriobacteriales bacterium]|jgi:hypothetical protein
MVTAHEAFVAVFYALDAAYDESKDEEIGKYLSDANPFLFNDRDSADPAIFEEYQGKFLNQFGDWAGVEESLEFSRAYLEEKSETLLAAFNSVVDDAKWKSAIEG